jgi:EAL domain-containing protein (putative c-di-GMP-specific phosphodiesterase class I)
MPPSAATAPAPLADLLAQGGPRAVFQPVVTLPDRRVVAYEALARGPVGSPLEAPADLFAAAAREGLVAELDWACRLAAMGAALDAGLPPSTALLINSEPDVLTADAPAGAAPLLARAERELTLVTEITERRLADRPAELLRAVTGLRDRGWGFALDDVGADWRSVALMPFLRPDLVKLDMRLVQEPFGAEAAAVVRAVRAYAQASGAQVLAEGIETEEHEERARSWGATLGQGWLYGRPAPLPELRTSAPDEGRRLVAQHAPPGLLTPVDIAERAGARFDVAPKEALLAHSIAMERRALADPDPVVVLGTFQSAGHFTTATARRYERLSRGSAFVGAFGVGMGEAPAEGVRGARLSVNEQLAGEWDVLVVGPHQASALIARDLGDTGPDRERRFAHTLVEDREVVLEAARGLMLRIAAAQPTR